MSIRGFSNGDHGGQRHPSGRPRLTPVGAPDLVARLQDWCRRAESSGIAPLAQFSLQLKRYA